MSGLRTNGVLLLALCFVFATAQPQDKSCESDELNVLIQNAMSVKRHDADPPEAKKEQSAMQVSNIVKSNDTSAQKVITHDKAEVNTSQVAEHQDLPDWIKNIAAKVTDAIPGTKDLLKTYDEVKSAAGEFTTGVATCITTLKTSPALTAAEKQLPEIQAAVKQAFTCLQTSITDLTGKVKDAATKTKDTLKSTLPDNVYKMLEAAEKTVADAAADFQAAAAVAVEDIKTSVPEINGTVVCAQVTKAIAEIEKTAVTFIEGMDSLSPTSAKEELKNQKELIEGFIENLPEQLKAKATELLTKVQEAADAVLENVPKGITKFKDGIVESLTDKVCPASELPSGASSLHLGLPMVLLVSMFLSGSWM